jgi:F0F1-type ATP synthase membrane subunit b/b'
MKKSILTLTTVVFLTGASLTSCNNSAEKVEKAEENVQEANQDLAKAQNEYMEDMENYRREMTVKFDENDKNIRDFNDRIVNEKKDAKGEYKKRLTELEEKNNEMRRRMTDYKADGKDNWESFKAEFNRDMEELGQAFKDLGENNAKDVHK